MNDRFRFRAWNKEEKKMYYDAQNTYDYMAGKPIIFAESFSCLLTDDEEWEVEQCTGLKDKNGNLIYEGDIVKGIATVDEGSFEYCGVVEWNDQSELIGWYIVDADGNGWELKQAHAKISSDNITGEIIGNIHEQKDNK